MTKDAAEAQEVSESIFHLLEGMRGRSASLEIRESDVELAGGRVAHAIDGQRKRMLLVPLEESQVAIEDTASGGVSLRPRTLVDRTLERRYLAVACELQELRDLFAILADEMLASLRSRPENPAATCQAVLDRWRELLAPRRERLLGPNALAGLLAELHVLETLATIDPGQAVKAWTGPSGARFDFSGRATSLEVKATTTREQFLVEIHGALQLQTTNERDLYLYAEQLEPTTTAGDSVPNAVARLKDAGIGAHTLLSRLADLGYLAVDEPAYDKVRFDLADKRLFRVDPEFPRITPESLNDPSFLQHITRLRYTLDLTDKSAFNESVDDVELLVVKLLE